MQPRAIRHPSVAPPVTVKVTRACQLLSPRALLKLMLLGVMPEGPVADVEYLRRLCSHPMGLFKRILQVAFLGIGDYSFKVDSLREKLRPLMARAIQRGRTQITRNSIRQDGNSNFRPGFKRDGTFDGVLQFADVARPIV